MSFTESPLPFAEPERRALLELAHEAIRSRLAGELPVPPHGLPPAIAPASLPATLLAPGAAFVTLHRAGELRGCIGSLEARRPLVADVAANARAAAFEDPRFPPLAAWELAGLAIHLAIVGPSVPLPAESEAELLATLRPGHDGLVLAEGPHRATFLPAVWESLPDPRDFLAHLKHKAGLPRDYWSPTLRFRRYSVEAIG